MSSHLFLKPHLAAQYSFQSKLVDEEMAHQPSRQYELILLGATGYTGKLVAEWISTHLPEDLKWAIAGRNAKKLQGVVDDLKQISPTRKQPGMSCDTSLQTWTNDAKRCGNMRARKGPARCAR
jgi:hypothetical protein